LFLNLSNCLRLCKTFIRSTDTLTVAKPTGASFCCFLYLLNWWRTSSIGTRSKRRPVKTSTGHS